MSSIFGLYIHIPFCKSKCSYCDFYSVNKLAYKEELLDCLLQEIRNEKKYTEGKQLSSIYIGGGTPSLLEPADFERLFEVIFREYDGSLCPEITLEANPDDLNPAYLKSLSSLAFNRISIGIQSFNDTELRALGRRHTASQAIKAVLDSQESGLNNISIDLMFGIPGQNTQSLQANIEQALELNVPHISAYMLSLETGTPLYREWQQGRFTELTDDEAENRYFQLAGDFVKAGYDHYEISNFARPGFRAIHNAAYWSGRAYLGIGPSAHSYNGRSRRWNPSSLVQYIEGIQTGKLQREEESLDLFTRYNEMILTRLRTKEGFSLEKLTKTYGKEWYDYCMKQAGNLLTVGKLELKDGYLRLPPSAYFVSDAVIRELFWDDSSLQSRK